MEKIIKTGKSFHAFKKESDTVTFAQDFTNYIKSFGETYFWEKGKFHVVTKASHAKEILTSSDYTADRGAFFISRMPNLDLNLVKDFFSVVKNMMVMSDDQDHMNKRKLSSFGFEDQIIDRFKVKIVEVVENFIASTKTTGTIEFVENISRKLPSIVLADLFSIPSEDREQFYQWSNEMTAFFGGASEYKNEDGIKVNHAALNLKNYFSKLIDLRIDSDENDYVSIMLRKSSKFDFSKDQIISQLIMMLVAGMATTTDQINNSMLYLATNPNLQNQLRADHTLIPKALEELKRLDPAVTFIFRLARKDTCIGNQPVKAGDVIFISTHAINRDGDLYANPDEININREFSAHFSYGFGPHYCIGAKLAREEMNNLFVAILKNWPSFKLSEKIESKRDHYSLSFSGFSELYLEFN